MTSIIGISGKKLSGKSTFSNYITGLHMVSTGVVGEFYISDEGHLILGEEVVSVDDIFARDSTHILKKILGPHISVYNYAECLKRNVCIDVLGLDESCFSQEGKTKPTQYKWKQFRKFLSPETKKLANGKDDEFMTVREILQVVGTDIFRTINNDVWVNATLRRIEKEAPAVAIVNDIRFPKEVEGIQKMGGKVIRLLRSVESDGHSSESELDSYDGFDAVIDNRELTLEQTAEKVCKALTELNLMPNMGV
jgi:hypothetical protein